ncbi:hypothetical protein HYT52_00470 [Candidatus Woesearchaeota archaeon]|nr:hypothetical protein [Candidatus Woesearchaeota archaeon]
MLVFGVDIPLIEILLALLVMIIILFLEAIIVVGMLIKDMNKTKKLAELIEKLSDTILQIKKAEIEELDKIRRK